MKLTFPAYIKDNEKIFSILGYISESTDYVDGKGYINNTEGIVCIYTTKKSSLNLNDTIPYFWKTADGDIEYSNLTPDMFKTFGIKNIVDLSEETIDNETVENEKLYDEELIMSINTSTSVFKPPIQKEDDFLKKLIKQAILDKNIDVKILENKLDKKNGLNNLKSALLGKTKMSTTNFIIWSELLGLNFEVIVSDMGYDKLHPLPQTLHYTSINDKLEKE